MELAGFWKEISLMPEAVRQLEEQKITEEEYQKLREIFYRDLDLFYEEVKQRKDFRQVFLYCYSKMACEVYDRYCERGISRQIYRDTFYDLTLWCENCYKAYGEYGIAQYDWFSCEVYDRYCERGISRQIYRDTFYDLTLWCENCYKAYGEYGIAQYDWFSRHLNLCLFRLGRLQFERMQSLWDIQTRHGAIHRGDPVISVHIPQGERLDVAACRDSFEQAERFWGKSDGYLCHSWLLYPGLQKIMKPGSNILQFQKLFQIVAEDFETREAEERIFGEVEMNPEDYAEDTSLQRAAKKYLVSGGKLGSGLGIWEKEEQV